MLGTHNGLRLTFSCARSQSAIISNSSSEDGVGRETLILLTRSLNESNEIDIDSAATSLSKNDLYVSVER